LCCVDARMGEVYSASFDWAAGLATPVAEERIGRPEAVEPPDQPYLAFGDGFSAHGEALARVIEAAEAVESAVVPGARQLLALARPEIAAGRFLPLEAALPVYLRGSDAWRKS
jgi:tRNA threonylcarbamoyladenosine biosynthesis protein TsaB